MEKIPYRLRIAIKKQVSKNGPAYSKRAGMR